MGMPGFEKCLARYPQLYSRIGFVHEFRALGNAEIGFILINRAEAFGLRLDENSIAEAKAMAAIIRIVRGNFRLLECLLTQVRRIKEIN